MDGDARRKTKPITKLLDAAKLDLDAATRLLLDPPNVLAANHLQQAAEKILSAVRLHRGLLNTKDHDLVILVDGRPQGEPRPLPPRILARSISTTGVTVCVCDHVPVQPRGDAQDQRVAGNPEVVARAP